MSFWTGFLETYGGKPAYIDAIDAERLSRSFKRHSELLPAKHWEAMTQSADNAAAWIEASFAKTDNQPLFLITDKSDTQLLLKAFLEASALLPPPLAWDISFTTFAQDSDVDEGATWIGGLTGSFVDDLADRLHVQREHLNSSLVVKRSHPCLRHWRLGVISSSLHDRFGSRI